jgi:hypothetical protein
MWLRSTRSKLLVAAGVVVLLGLGLVASTYEVQGNAAVPYDAGTVKEVRVLDAVTVYVDGEPKPGANVLGGIALLVLGTAAFMTAAALRIAMARRRLALFYLLAALGLGYAGLDELFAIHESIGHNLRFLADVPGVSRPDDLVIAMYLIPALAFAYVFRDVFLSDRLAAMALACGIGFFALSTLADLTSLRVEEWLELVAGLWIATGLVLLIRTHLKQNLQIRVGVVGRSPAAEAPQPAPPGKVPAGTS